MHLSLVAHNILTVVSTTITILKYIKLELLVGFFVSPNFPFLQNLQNYFQVIKKELKIGSGEVRFSPCSCPQILPVGNSTSTLWLDSRSRDSVLALPLPLRL